MYCYTYNNPSDIQTENGYLIIYILRKNQYYSCKLILSYYLIEMIVIFFLMARFLKKLCSRQINRKKFEASIKFSDLNTNCLANLSVLTNKKTSFFLNIVHKIKILNTYKNNLVDTFFFSIYSINRKYYNQSFYILMFLPDNNLKYLKYFYVFFFFLTTKKQQTFIIIICKCILTRY